MITHTNRIYLILSAVAGLLLLPLIAMQFSTEVNWSSSDFLIMGVLLLCTGLAVEFVLRKVKKTTHRLMLCAAVLFAFLLIWAELAVGVFGSVFAGS